MLIEHLPFFNSEGEEFKKLVEDKNYPYSTEIKNINDFNSGAIYNALKWHIEFQKEIIKQCYLINARDFYLDEHNKIYGIERPTGFSDEEFISFIISKITSAQTSFSVLVNLLKDFIVYDAGNMGMFSDLCFSDINILDSSFDKKKRFYSSIITFFNNSIYAITDNPDKITNALSILVRNSISAGFAVYVGIIQ